MASTGKPPSGDVTQLLLSWSEGRQAALDELMPLVYHELHRLATSYLRRERSDHTMQPTALIHEAYVRLVDQATATCHSRSQFFAISANLMRQILVNHAERHKAAKRGGGNKVDLNDVAQLTGQSRLIDVLEVHHALNKLAELDPRQGRIVEMRFFGGLTEDEIAEVLGVSETTVRREWRTAKAVLHHELRHGSLE